MLDCALIEEELKAVAEASPISDQSTLEFIRETASAGEYGIAFNTLRSWIVEDDLAVTNEYYQRIRDLSEILGAAPLVDLMSQLVIDD